jgi:hypothetical protein
MKHSLQLLAVSTVVLLPATASRMAIRAAGEDYDTRICFSDIEDTGIIPPCISLEVIEGICLPNGTELEDYTAHAECMCQSSFFMNWRDCQSCLLDHGPNFPGDDVYWDGMISLVSKSVCQGTPTADFDFIFSSARAYMRETPVATAGGTRSSDGFPGKKDVSLYDTATARVGTGLITRFPATATRVSMHGVTSLRPSRTCGVSNQDTAVTGSSYASVTGYESRSDRTSGTAYASGSDRGSRSDYISGYDCTSGYDHTSEYDRTSRYDRTCGYDHTSGAAYASGYDRGSNYISGYDRTSGYDNAIPTLPLYVSSAGAPAHATVMAMVIVGAALAVVL